MKRALYIIIAINIVSGIISGFMLLSQSIILGLLCFFFAGIGIIPYLLIIQHCDDIESLRAEISFLRSEIFKIQNSGTSDDGKKRYATETANQKWQCLKCKAVNPAGTNVCQNCGDFYSSFDNPPNKYRETTIR